MAAIRVYIAGPYSSNPTQNTKKALLAAENLIAEFDHKVAPYVPHLTMLWDLVFPRPYNFWLEYDLEWLRVCNLLLRLPGASEGSDSEVKFAKRQGIPTFLTFSDVRDNIKEQLAMKEWTDGRLRQ